MNVMQLLQMAALGSPRVYATWDAANKGSGITLSGDLLTATSTAIGNPGNVGATLPFTTGQRYFELNTSSGNNQTWLGIASGAHTSTARLTNNPSSTLPRWYYDQTTNFGNIGAALKGAGVYGFEVDFTAQTIAIRDGGGIWNTISWASGSGNDMTGAAIYIWAQLDANAPGTMVLNSGQSAFSYTPTTGFLPGWYQ